MGQKENLKNQLKKFLNEVTKEIKIQKIVLFGSRARDDFREDSDFDLIIVSKDFEGKGFFERVKLMYNYWDLDYAVDFICYTPSEFENLRNKISIVREAIKEGIKIK